MKQTDTSFKSLTILENKISEYLNSEIKIIDWPVTQNNKVVNNIVIAGLYYRRIFEINYWQDDNFYLHCISNRVHRVLCDVFCFDQNCINTIPRYKLFPVKSSTINFDINNFNLIYGGRISPQKNIEFLIFINFYLQLFHNSNCNLTLMGDFDNENHNHTIGINSGHYEYRINTLIQSLPWIGKPPLILSGLSENEWIEQVKINDVFISASTLISEDFSVSVAQIQEMKGNPCLLPAWGGFRDIIGENIMFFNSDLIADSNAPLSKTSTKAKLFVEKLLNNNLKISIPETKNDNSIPTNLLSIDKSYIQKKIEENCLKWGDDILFLTEGKLIDFAKSKTGKQIFGEIIKIFSS